MDQKPVGKTLGRGGGWNAYTAGHVEAQALKTQLEQEGFVEKPEQSILREDYGIVGESWTYAMVTESPMFNSRGETAVLSHVVSSAEPKLSGRRPEASVFPATVESPGYVVRAETES